MKNLSLSSSGSRAGRSPRRHYRLTLLLAFSLLSFAARGNANTVTVRIASNGELAFSPSSVTIQVGDTVQWEWDSSGHSTTSGTPDHPDGVWDSGVQNIGFTFSHTFLTAGSFPYYCTPHGGCCGMIGTVTVSAPTPTPSPSPTTSPSPTVSPTPSTTPSPTASPSPSPSATPVEPTLANISTRGQALTGDQVMIGGFIIGGTDSKKLIVRAIGPSLTQFGVPGAMADPTLELHHTEANNQDVTLATNNNWMDAANKQEIIDSGLAPTNNLESAILEDNLDPGAYTAIVRGVNDTTGVALVEVYDLNTTGVSVLANISTRGFVGTGGDVLIGGIIVVGGSDQQVLIRAIGPSLTPFGVTGALSDPVLELHDKDGNLIVSNDDWKDTQEQAIMLTGIAPTNDAESAILATLAPGAYTAIVSGKDNTTGVALVEAYQVDN